MDTQQELQIAGINYATFIVVLGKGRGSRRANAPTQYFFYPRIVFFLGGGY
jgi:hypothetical protein